LGEDFHEECIETVPEEYMTDDFRVKFYLESFEDSGEYCYIDDIAIVELEPDTDCVFKINGDQVYFEGGINPAKGTGNITATEWEVLENQPNQHSYACSTDVTFLLKAYSDTGDDEQPTGNGLYTVSGVDATPNYHWSYAGWSLIIIYFSPETAGHQLYLFEDFAWAKENQNLDFDFDGNPGGTIDGFVIPEPIEGEVNAARLTCFVAEGDTWWMCEGDQMIFNGTALSDGIEIDDVWNSASIGMTEDGMDIDTFTITWASGLLEPGDTSATIDLPTNTDNWNLIYMILSVRTQTTVAGTSHYVIRSG